MRTLIDKVLLLPVVLLLLALLYLGGRAFIADRFIIPTWSMAPTLVPGDRVVVSKLLMGARIYTDFDFREGGQELKSVRMKGLRRLKHNDIVVFNYPQVGERIAFQVGEAGYHSTTRSITMFIDHVFGETLAYLKKFGEYCVKVVHTLVCDKQLVYY